MHCVGESDTISALCWRVTKKHCEHRVHCVKESDACIVTYKRGMAHKGRGTFSKGQILI